MGNVSQELTQIGEQLDLAISSEGQWGPRRWVLERRHDVLDACQDQFGGVGEGHGDFGREPGDCVADANLASLPNPTLVTAVGVQSRTHVPAVNAVWRPGLSDVGVLVDQDADARRRKWRPVEVKGTTDLGPG